jgi:hypothetical protein
MCANEVFDNCCSRTIAPLMSINFKQDFSEEGNCTKKLPDAGLGYTERLCVN